MKRMSAARLTQIAMLVAVAAALQVLERFLPLEALIPLPGIKLGLANIVTMFALFHLNWRSSLAIVVARCLLGALLGGGITGLAFSLVGSLLALFVMMAIKPGYGRLFSLFGVSVGGAAAHNLGQVLVAMTILGDRAILAYLPVLMVTGVATGILTAAVSIPFFRKFGAARAAGGVLDDDK